MSLDSRFVIASDLQSLFRDKDTGLPLSNGVVYFWKDQARSEPKDVYKLSGSPPNYSYTNIGAVINLTSAGTMSDNENPANDIILYYFPYEGTPEPDGSDGTTELYYVQVYSEGGTSSGVLQFTREAWPNLVTTENAAQNLINYIPNGQFKIHSNVEVDPNNTTAVAGQISQAITNLAQGGWTFERPNMSAATDIVLFEPFGGYVSNPSASPTYFVKIECTSPSAGDDFKDLRIKFDDVNKFASATQEYTFAFAGQGNGSSVNVALILIKNFDDGTDPVETPLANFVVTTSFTILQKSGFVFGDNTGKTIGPNNWLQLALRFPTGSLFSVSLTDFILTPGAVIVTDFPQTTDREFAAQSITPERPAYDNSDLYLPVRLGPQGLIYDTSEIGEVIAESNVSVYVNSLHPTTNKLLADGTQYETAAFSHIGIPYARLQAKYWNNNLNLPIYGTGLSYLTAYIADVTPASELRIPSNSSGSATNAVDGVVPTGFTIATIVTGSTITLNAYHTGLSSAATVFVRDQTAGTRTAPTAGTSGFTITDGINDTLQRHTFFITTVAATGLAGTYFTFSTAATNYYMWFTVDGGGSDPMQPGTGIKVDLKSTYPADEVARIVTEAISGRQITTIVTVAGSAVPPGSYFSINTPTPSEYYVWYSVSGTGNDPAPANKTPIRVNILSTDTAAQVATKTQQAINQKYFAVPDYRGLFLRGWAHGSANDPDRDGRWSDVTDLFGDNIGTSEMYAIESHYHSLGDGYSGVKDDLGGEPGDINVGTAYLPNTLTYGGAETRPINIYVNYAIRY